MDLTWPKRILCGHDWVTCGNGRQTDLSKAKSDNVFGQARKQPKMFRAGLYARVQQTLAMQSRAMREYAVRRSWTITLQVREVGSGAAKREAREKLLEAARRREIDLVLVWRLDRWGRSLTDLLATLQELEHLGVGFVSLTEALDLTMPSGRAMAGLLAIFADNAERASSADRAHLGPPNPQSKVMKRPKRDPVREDRIHNEAIVDAGPDEQAMSWYYYLESKITFPFQARCVAAKDISPLRKGETTEVVRMAAEAACEHDMLVQIRWQGRNMAVPLSQLNAIDPDESTKEAIGDWHYWVSQGCLL